MLGLTYLIFEFIDLLICVVFVLNLAVRYLTKFVK